MSDLQAEALRLLDLGLLPIPGAEKAPSGVRHKNGVWTREIARREIKKFAKCPTLCILTDSTPNVEGIITNLIVFDFDDEQSYEWMRNKFPIIDTAPLVKTTHGYHVYFLRSQLCEDYQITDGARALRKRVPDDEGLPCDEKGKLLIDVKTHTSVLNEDGSYTASVLSVPPSKNKVWVRPFPEIPLFALPDVLSDWIHVRRVSSKKRPMKEDSDSQISASKKIAGLQLSDRIEPNLSALQHMGFVHPIQTATFDDVSEHSRQRGYCMGAQFVDPGVQNGGPCPLCNKSDGHQSNNYSLLIKVDGSRFVKNLSGSCAQRFVQVPWTEESIRAHFNAWVNTQKVGMESKMFRDFTAYTNDECALLVRAQELLFLNKSGTDCWRSRTPWDTRMRTSFIPSRDFISSLFF